MLQQLNYEKLFTFDFPTNCKCMKTILLTIFVASTFLTAFVNPKPETYKVSVEDSKLIWTGERVKYGHSGTVNVLSGELILDKKTLKGGTFAIDMTSIQDKDLEDEKRNGRLTGHLKSADFFDVEKFPLANFVITKAKQDKVDKGTYEVTGDLTVKGVTAPVTFKAEIENLGETIQAKGLVVFDRTVYNVKYGSGSFFDELGDKAIGDEISLQVELVANQQ